MSSYSFTLTAPGPTPEAGSGSGSGLPGSYAARALVGEWDLRFDPITLDLVDDGLGAFEITTTAATAVLHQLLIDFDKWWGDAEIGSRLNDLDLFIADPGELIADETRRALGALVDAGRIVDVVVVATETQAGRVDVRTAYRDAQSGQPVDLSITPAGA